MKTLVAATLCIIGLGFCMLGNSKAAGAQSSGSGGYTSCACNNNGCCCGSGTSLGSVNMTCKSNAVF